MSVSAAGSPPSAWLVALAGAYAVVLGWLLLYGLNAWVMVLVHRRHRGAARPAPQHPHQPKPPRVIR